MELKIKDDVKILSTNCRWNGNCSAHEENGHTCIGKTAIVREIDNSGYEGGGITIEFGHDSICTGFKYKNLKLLNVEWNEEENE